MVSPVKEYLRELHEVHALGAGTGETALYPALQRLLNEIGKGRRPRVFCISQLADAGHPDYGLFTVNQLPRDNWGAPMPGMLPERGVVEAKKPSADLRDIAASRQVAEYWERYGLVLVTSFRDFLVVGRDQFGRCAHLEQFTLAESEAALWALAAQPAQLPAELETRCVEFLTRVLLHNAPLVQPRDVAWFLASYARDTLARLDAAARTPAPGPTRLDLVRKTLEDALGITFEGEKGGHFFRSTLVQTLYYGLFSAWVLWCRQHADAAGRKGFSAMGAAWHLRLPVLRGLFEQVNTPGALGPLRLHEVLEWAAATLRRVDDRAFFARFQQDRAVQYFYEPFLEAFDPALRKQLGVWYTPPEVVDYMVERVDRVLREELGIADGLADERVLVLDPCCGTGSYLVAVLWRIARTLDEEQGLGALVPEYVKKAAMKRVFGFEIMPAPFVVAHLQLSLFLESLGAPLAEQGSHTNQRAEWPAVLLTNALTGWDPARDKPDYLPLPDLQDEMDAARKIKREDEILVVLGNPPYNGFAGVSDSAEERGLTAFYRRVRRCRPPEGQGLNDLYVRFYRMAERRIAEQTGKGVVCFISNYSWLDGLSFTGMRERYLEVYDRIWIDCLNGDKFKTGKVTPDGLPDPSIFSTEHNREGIGVGTCIALLVRKEPHAEMGSSVRFRHFWGRTKHEQLLATADNDGVTIYQNLQPSLELGLPFMPAAATAEYFSWPVLTSLLPTGFPGVKTSRDDFLVDIDRDQLVQRLEIYFDRNLTDEEVRCRIPEAMTDAARFDARATRARLISRGPRMRNITRFCYRPFDLRWLYWEPETKLLDEKRSDYFFQVFPDNLWIEVREKQVKPGFDRGYATRHLGDNFGNGLSSFFPLYLQARMDQLNLEQGNLDYISDLRPNLTIPAMDYCKYLSCSPSDLFFHIIFILNDMCFRKDNAGVLCLGWPRIPLPAAKDRLAESAALGRHVAALLDPESAADGINQGRPRPELRPLGVMRRLGVAALDLRITAGWGHAGQNGVTMPGRGDARQRAYSDEERAAIAAGAAAQGLDPATAFACLGTDCVDVFLNHAACWSCVPARVWAYTIGGYQVIKKWLSYREHALLGRPLMPEEAQYVGDMVRRIAALLLLEPALDANYRAVVADPYPWPAT